MTDQSIFNQEPQQPAQEPTQVQEPTPAPAPDYTELLSGVTNAEGKPKYSNVEDALKALPHANTHIQTLEEENRRLREAAEKVPALEDLVANMQTAQTPATSGEPPVSMEAITNIVQQTIQQRETEATVQQNQSTVADELSKVFGEKAEELYIEKSKELGIDPDTLNALAGKSPAAVLSWFDLKGQKPPTKTETSVNPEAVLNNGTQQPAPKRSVMGSSSSETVVSEWQRIKAEVEADIQQ